MSPGRGWGRWEYMRTWRADEVVFMCSVWWWWRCVCVTGVASGVPLPPLPGGGAGAEWVGVSG